MLRFTLTFALALIAFAALAPSALAQPLRLHVPSPDWRDQVLYFVLTDRFADGNPRNNDQGAGEYKPGDGTRYQGGDLAGLTARLSYIQGLGATAVWITPPVANQWRDPSNNYGGYHGYWAEHLMKVDKHLGTLADYRRLSHGLHVRGMYLVQDIVVNHMGNYFSYRDRWRAGSPAAGWEAHDRTAPVPRPSQPPFHLNDPRDPAQRRAGIYHWTPDITDYTDPRQVFDHQMSSLDDLNTENPRVRRALRESFGHWVREVGVDAFRVDTAFYVPPEYFLDFLHARDAQAPGLAAVARRTGRRAFHVFGEGFAIDRPFEDTQSLKIERYMHGEGGQPVLPGMLNFPLYGALGDVFARGQPPAVLGHRITRMMALHPRVHWMPTFVDNHDVDRFLAGGSERALRQALLAMFTLPGIPVIYYGTEQGLLEQRGAMFAAGFGSGGRDHFDTQAPLYRYIAELAALRRGERLFSRGTPTVLAAQAAQAGGVAWLMRAPKAEPGAALVAINTSDSEALLPHMATGLTAGTVLRGRFGIDGTPPAAQVVGADGRISLRLPAHSAQVWLAESPAVATAATAGVAAAASPTAAGGIEVEPLPAGAVVEGDFRVAGKAPPGARLRLVLDGDLGRAQAATASASGQWETVLNTERLAEGGPGHTLDVMAEDERLAAPPTQPFQLRRRWETLLEVADPVGDDHGPTGQYRYPTDPGWGARRQLDLRGLRASTAGGALRLELQMGTLTRGWNPANGFDRVAFTVLIELPGQEGGSAAMPLQDGRLPEGMRWHLRLRAHGWSNALYSARGATAQHEGTPLAPAATLEVDRERNTVSLTVPRTALGTAGSSWRGARLYINTWDFDGGYRALEPQPGAYTFGGAAVGSPKVMDDIGPVRLP